MEYKELKTACFDLLIILSINGINLHFYLFQKRRNTALP